ncbi:unnamed protein product [Discosporangium mesarthrocarpum]
MSFNMLAQCLARSSQFPYVAMNQLKRQNRWPKVWAEIERYGADLICLQECDLFPKILANLMHKEGFKYRGVYKEKTGGSPHGLGIIYNALVFELVKTESCEFGEELNNGVALFCLLRHRAPAAPYGAPGVNASSSAAAAGGGAGGEASGKYGNPKPSPNPSVGGAGEDGVGVGSDGWGHAVCIVNTHLYWHPEGDSIRLAQASATMMAVQAFLREECGDSYEQMPLILAGDLNTQPGTGVYKARH